mmetsp:Transcript_12835/g.35943  ORF Transcript_12835/g.35943 Transcript_12835/m.35943 type:complete len:451 (+) Transcript_12835:22-1374(+)
MVYNNDTFLQSPKLGQAVLQLRALLRQVRQLRLGGNEDGSGHQVDTINGDGHVAVSPWDVEVVQHARSEHAEGIEHDAAEGQGRCGGNSNLLFVDAVEVEVKDESKTEPDENIEHRSRERGRHGNVPETPLGHGQVAGVVPDRVAPSNHCKAQDTLVNRGDAPDEGDHAHQLRGNEIDPKRGKDEADQTDYGEAKGELRPKLQHGRVLCRGVQESRHPKKRGGHCREHNSDPIGSRKLAAGASVVQDPKGQPRAAGNEEGLEVHLPVHRRNGQSPCDGEGYLQNDEHLADKVFLFEEGPTLVPHLVQNRVNALVALVIELEKELLRTDHGLVAEGLQENLPAVDQGQVRVASQVLLVAAHRPVTLLPFALYCLVHLLLVQPVLVLPLAVLLIGVRLRVTLGAHGPLLHQLGLRRSPRPFRRLHSSPLAQPIPLLYQHGPHVVHQTLFQGH